MHGNEKYHSLTATTSLLLEGLKKPNNGEVWAQFVTRYRPLIVGYARRCYGMKQQDAEDGAQAVLANFYDSYRQGKYDRAQGRLRHWLFGIANNTLAQSVRQVSRRKEVNVSDKSWGGRFLENVQDNHRLEEEWEAQWRRVIFDHCLNEVRCEFDPVSMQAFTMLLMEQKPAQHIADKLKISRNSVYLAKHRITRRVRERIEELGDDL